MFAHIQWNGASITATVLTATSLCAAVVSAVGHVELLLPSDVFGQPNSTTCLMLAIVCFAISVLTFCSVYNNYAPSQLKFHAVGLLPVIVLAIYFGFWANVIQNTIIAAVCAYFGLTLDKRPAEKPEMNLPTILMGLNLLILIPFCLTPFFMTPDELFPQLAGRVNTITFQMFIASTVVYVVPLTANVIKNRASQVQPWWAACLFFNAAAHMMDNPIDRQNAMSNLVLAVAHIYSTLYSAKTDGVHYEEYTEDEESDA